MIKSVLDLLEGTAGSLASKTALADDKTRISFSELQSLAQNIGSELLRAFQPRYSRPVIVLVDRRVEPIVAFMGVLYSGNFYVPVDNRTPKDRMQAIIDVLDPIAIIGFGGRDSNHRELLDDRVKYFEYAEVSQSATDRGLLEKTKGRMLDVDPVYAIFTSGSTGVPKAVLISHKSVLDLSNWLEESFGFDSTDVLGNQTPFYFDASVKDIYISLRTGATIYVIPPKCFSFPKLLMENLHEEKVTTILWATSAVVLTAKSGILTEADPLPDLKRVFFAGEAMYGKHLNLWRAAYPNCRYINLYGPTEITVDCSYYIVDRDFDDEDVVPIGAACENKQLFLLDENDEILEGPGVGELAVRGTGLALGYYNNPEQTCKVFIQNPMHRHYVDRIYKTGDNALLNEFGEYEFVGRRDFQIKHMGNRIELGEIEAAVYALDSINQAACIYDKDREKIVLYYSAEQELKPVDFLKFLADRLPKYMFPNEFFYLQKMPMNPNGKIDRVYLKKMDKI